MNNKSNIKKWLKTLILEIKESLNADETYSDYVIEVDNLVVPEISQEGDTVELSVDINYNISGGHPETGQFGSPAHATQEEGSSVEIVNAIPVTITVNNVEKAVKSLKPEQIEVIKEYLSNYLADNEEKIGEEILSSNMNENRMSSDDEVGYNNSIINQLKTKIQKEFQVKDKGNFKEIQFSQDKSGLNIHLYFKLINAQTLTRIISLAKKLNGELSISCEKTKDAVCVKFVMSSLKQGNKNN